MSLMMPGVYDGEVGEKPFEAATAYQLSYYVSSALITLDLIQNPDENMMGRFPYVARYYRYYVDQLFYLLGQISSRFMKKRKQKDECKTEHNECNEQNERNERNRRNYEFSKDTFKILSNRKPRNLIEHLDERNIRITNAYGIVGGFNVVREGSPPDVVESVTKNRKNYPYTLNLIDGKVMFCEPKSDQITTYDIYLKDIETELLMLQKNIEDFKSFL